MIEFTQVDHEIAVFSEVKGITLCWVNLDCRISSASCSLIVSRAQRAAADGARPRTSDHGEIGKFSQEWSEIFGGMVGMIQFSTFQLARK